MRWHHCTMRPLELGWIQEVQMIDLQGEKHVSPNKYGIKNTLSLCLDSPFKGGNLNKEEEE